MMKIIEPAYDWAWALTPRSVTTHLIIHHAACNGPVEAVHEYHKSLGWAGVAYHYYVRKDGTVYRGRPEGARGGHTTNWNWCALGVCFEGNFETDRMEKAQLEAGRELIADVLSRYPEITVGRHLEFQATSCPGRNLPFKELLMEKSEPNSGVEDRDEPSPWAEEACRRLTELGLFRGDGNGCFRWREPVTRQELAVLLDRLSLLS